MSPGNKSFLENYHRELGKRQREYKKVLLNKIKNRNESILEQSYKNQIDKLLLEKNDLRAQIWVASSNTHKSKNKRHLRSIYCQLKCQENLALETSSLKTSITNMELEIHRVEKEIYNLNRRIVPESQHQEHVKKARKKLSILDNALEVGIRCECSFMASNAELRGSLVRVLLHRKLFNEIYSKIVKTLDRDKKFMIDLIEHALNSIDGCIEVYEKIGILKRRDAKENELRKIEMQGVMHKIVADEVLTEFLEAKSQPNQLADLQEKEYKRRDKFRHIYQKKIDLYRNVLDKILSFTKTNSLNELLTSYRQQETIYYSYFNYATEVSYHITLLNNNIEQLYRDVLSSKKKVVLTLESQLEELGKLEIDLKEKQQNNEKLEQIDLKNGSRLKSLLQDFEWICNLCGANTGFLKKLPGNNDNINVVNYNRFLKLIESRIQIATACVFVEERKDGAPGLRSYAVKGIDRYCDPQTNLNDIVLTQQCPECAEGEAFNMDVDDAVTINTVEEAKKKLYEKITQPEMQYRLHSLSKCRLPRSRHLAAKRQN